MTFQESIRICFTKYADFSGTASRSEYGWFVLFLLLAHAAAAVVSPFLAPLFTLATLPPLLAAGARRLREAGLSGWWQLLILVPVGGAIALVVLLVQAPRPEGARA